MESLHHRVAVSSSESLGLGLRLGLEHPLVVARHHLGEPRQRRSASRRAAPRPPSSRSPRRAGAPAPAARRRRRRRPAPSSTSSWLTRPSSRSSTKAYAAGHAGREVAAGRAEDDDAAAGHVLAAVVAHALDDRGARRSCGRRTARRPGRAGRSRPTWRRSAMTLPAMICSCRLERRRPVGADHDPAAGEALADVVVGVALEPQRDARGHERAERLAGRAGEGDVDGAVGQALAPGSAWSPRGRGSCRRCG